MKPHPTFNRTKDVTGRSRWKGRLLVACVVPLLALGGLELGLRWSGFGYPTSFLLPARQGDQDVWIPNSRFTWRFFGPRQARQPTAFALSRPKPADVTRIFVLGESAAFGDPQPDFGMTRMLQAMLEWRFPDARFDVVNVAITGVNSHAIVPIARGCAQADGDIWVVYMGNNEVVGPFGAGTVFGSQAPPLPLIRANLAARSTRLGQGLERIVRRFQPGPADKQEWGGMLMFVENRVPAGDPRMESVYHHFERNLVDILDLARRGGVGVVLSTVAVNLQDCPPFGSAHRDGLKEEALERWQSLVQRGSAALTARSPAEALSLLRQAADIDGSAAELHYLMGTCHAALGDLVRAEEALGLARDLDTLRFRCDGQLNSITRRLAGDRAGQGLTLVDMERAFAAYHLQGKSDQDLFYDHVHLSFRGTYLLAAAIAREVVLMLPPDVRAGANRDWPSIEACAMRLAWTPQQEAGIATQMLGRYQEPPFTFQLDHQAQVQRRRARVIELESQASAGGENQAADALRQALALAPDDIVLHQNLAESLHQLKNLEGAEMAARRVVSALPYSKRGWIRLGRILTDRGDTHGAIEALHTALQLDPGDEVALFREGAALALAGRMVEAEATMQQAIEANPRLGPAYLALMTLQDASGRTAEADASLRMALANRMPQPVDLSATAEACRKRKWYPEALTNLLTAINLSPANPTLHLQAANCLDAMGDPDEARRHYLQAVNLAPDAGETHYLLGLSYGLAGDPASALRHFEQTARLLPDLPEGHLNLAIAQIQTGRREDAIRSLHEVLRLQPDNQLARRHLARLQAGPAAPSPKLPR